MLLLKSGVLDSTRDQDGKTCWHIAAEKGSTPVLKHFIELGPDTAQSMRRTSEEGRTPLASAILNAETETALLLLDHCEEELEVFQSDESLLDKAVAVGSHDLFTRLHEKMEQAGAKETLQGSKHINNINMTCSPELLDYMLITWTIDNRSRCDALGNYLLDVNNTKFEDPAMYPKRVEVDRIIRQLLPLAAVTDDGNPAFDFWNIFCDKVIPNLTVLCHHNEGQCRTGLISMIFEILIEADVLGSYERNAQLPSYRLLCQSLFSRGKDVKCSWITSSVQQAIQVSTLSENVAGDAACNRLLSLAVQQSNLDLVKQLLHHGVDVHAAHGVFSPTEQACYASDLPTFELIINQADRSLFNRAGNQGKTLLHWAVSGTVPGYLTKIQRLLKLGADIDAKVDDANEDTALTLASRSESEDVIALLVSEGADVLHQAHDGWSMLHTAALTGNLRFIQSLTQSDVSQSFWLGTCQYPLVRIGQTAHITQNVVATHLAAAKGRSNFLLFMAQHNLPLDVNTVTGFPNLTPLHLASLFGHLDVVELLLAAEANVNAKDRFGELPIDLAARDGYVPVVKVLLKSGSHMPSGNLSASIALLMSKETEEAENSGNSKAMSRFLFEQAIIKGDLDQCKSLVKRGESMNAELFTHSYTPLVRAVVQGQTAVVDWLISLGVEMRSAYNDRLHPSLRCIASLATHYISSPQTLSAIISLALRQNVGWHGSTLGPLHVAILDNKVEALEVILRHIRENEHAYRKMIETELICNPADTIRWRGRTALSILVGSFNREALLSSSPWARRLPLGSPLHWAIRHSNVSAVRLLLKHEADVNGADSLGMTPMELAVLSTHPTELVQELLQAGAALEEPSRRRIDAMGAAVRSGNLDLVKILAEADPETLKCVDQFTADLLLKTAGSAASFQYLLCAGANPAEMTKTKHSPITFRLGPGDRLRPFLIHSGLFFQSSEESLTIALSNLAYEGSLASIRLIKMLRRALSNGVFTRTLNWTSRDIGSPLCLAASVNAAGMAEALIGWGAKLEMEGCRYGSPLMAACAWGNLDAAKVLVRAGALPCYVNEEGLLRSAISAASRHQKVTNWLLVGRYTKQPKIDCQPSQVTSHESVWSGPRLFRLALPVYMHRDFDESRWGHLRRLQNWREELRGSALAESRRDSGLDFYAESEAESRIKAAEAAHESFLMELGEA